MQLLHRYDGGAPLGSSDGHCLQRFENLLPLTLRVEMFEGLVRAGKAEQLVKKRKDPLEGWFQQPEVLAELLLDLERVVALLDLEVRPQNFKDRPVRRLPAVGHTVPFEPGHTLSFQRLAKLVQQTRLADSRVSHDADDLAAARLGTRQAVVEQTQLQVSTHKFCESPLDAHLHACSSPPAAKHPVDLNRLSQTLDLDRPQGLAPDVLFDEPMDRLGDQDRVGLGEILHP